MFTFSVVVFESSVFFACNDMSAPLRKSGRRGKGAAAASAVVIVGEEKQVLVNWREELLSSLNILINCCAHLEDIQFVKDNLRLLTSRLDELREFLNPKDSDFSNLDHAKKLMGPEESFLADGASPLDFVLRDF